MVNTHTPQGPAIPFLGTETVGFPGGSVVKTLPANEGDMGSLLDLGRFHMCKAAKSMHHNY